MICASLALLHPLLSLTHWIFRSLMLPYKSSSHSANHVRCASLRSGGRRLAVRKTIEYQIGALPRTPFPAAREFAPVGSMSLDSRVAGLPYESSSFATSRGNEKYEEKNRGVICFRYHFGVFPLWWLAPPPCPVGSVSLDSRVAELPYESSFLVTPSSRWHNKAPRFYLFISGSTLSTGCSAP